MRGHRSLLQIGVSEEWVWISGLGLRLLALLPSSGLEGLPRKREAGIGIRKREGKKSLSVSMYKEARAASPCACQKGVKKETLLV